MKFVSLSKLTRAITTLYNKIELLFATKEELENGLNTKSNTGHDHAVANTSSNGFMSKDDKSKLDGISKNANNYTHPSTHSASMINQDTAHRFVSDTEKATWNAKASTNVATTDANGLMGKDDKSKLNGIEANANNYTHPSSHGASMITQDATHRFVSDTEKASWNAKASTSVASTTANGLMSSSDKAKLDGIAKNANNYTHPSTHDGSIISQDSTHRFVSDTEKATWNAKASTSVATTTANGLMSKDDKAKLNGIAANANNYSHPSAHGASMITQDETHRFVTDTEKATWNAKASTNVVTTDANGLMSKDDKSKLDGISTGAQRNSDITKGEIEAKLTGTIGSHNHNNIISRGKVAAEKGTARPSVDGLSMSEAYDNDYPISYGNVLNLKGQGDGQILVGWSGSSGEHAPVYVRSKRDVADANWSGWAEIYTTANKPELSELTQSSSYRFVTDSEKATWNAKASTAVATTTANGLMSKDDKAKLDGIAKNANNYSHPSAHGASMITQDETHRFVTDTEKATWNAKASTSVATTTANGLMSKDDKSKLNGIAANANNYSHPSTHGASMITQDSTHRFVSDTEKATWNAKASTAVATTSANGLMSSSDKSKLDGISTGAQRNSDITKAEIENKLTGTIGSHVHNNLPLKGEDTITSKANDTTANWGAHNTSVHWYTTSGQLIDQPSQWGYLLNIGKASEVHQIWFTQASGNLHHRGGNGSGWSGSWMTILDSNNYSGIVKPGNIGAVPTATVGSLSSLNTSDKTNIVSAINEINSKLGNGLSQVRSIYNDTIDYL